MPFHFTVLASGSSGNVSYLELAGRGYLLDIGLGPRLIAQRLAVHGATWNCVHAVLLTHTHADHWKAATLRHLWRRSIPIHCHPHHCEVLSQAGPIFELLGKKKLIRPYEAGQEFELSPELRCHPIVLNHDSATTFGFRFEGRGGSEGPHWTLGYAADLGSWDHGVVEALSDTDLLALEFNHDVGLEYASGRPARLIARVLGERGHLSNHQAAALLVEILRRDGGKRLLHLVQLHLSRECNRPEIAAGMAQAILQQLAPHVHLHTTAQHRPSPRFTLGQPTPPARPHPMPITRTRSRRRWRAADAYLPGMEPWG
jgi:phosphoribosyl 1,2-cyclic phosphodiesterase